MADNSNALYSPYGAYELKSKYQRNMFFATSITTGFVALLLLTFWLVSDAKADDECFDCPTSDPPEVIANLEPPPLVQREWPQVNVRRPKVEQPKFVPMTAVPDEEIPDDDKIEVIGRNELEIIEIGDGPSGDEGNEGNEGNEGIDSGILEGFEYNSPNGEFLAVEIMPEMVYEVQPEYPRLAEEAGLDGIVWITVLVGRDGDVLEAVIAKSSDIGALDDAALRVAKQNRFKPGVQNGHPVSVWVTYKVEFILRN